MILMIKALLFQSGNMAEPTESSATRRRPFWLRPQLIVPAFLLVFWYVGDAILGFILHLIHIVIELGEMGVEHLLEALFHVEGHTAQMLTAWTGLFIFIAVAKVIQILPVFKTGPASSAGSRDSSGNIGIPLSFH